MFVIAVENHLKNETYEEEFSIIMDGGSWSADSRMFDGR